MQQQQPPPLQQSPSQQSPPLHSHQEVVGVLPVGPITRPPKNEETAKADEERNVLRKDIYSVDDEAGMAAEEAWLEDETIQELDESITDPNRVFSRIAGIRKAIARRAKRLDRAKDDMRQQQAVVDSAQLELETRAAAVAAEEMDLQRFKELHADLSRRHAELTEAAAHQQGIAEARQPSQKTQQVLWEAASNLRGLGADPRIEQAIAMLGSLFQTASEPGFVEAAGAIVPAAPVSTAPGPQANQRMPHRVAVPPPTNQSAPPLILNPPLCAAVPIAPAGVHVALDGGPHKVEHTEPSFSSGSAALHAPAKDLEMDDERGRKRSCQEAALPERAVDGQKKPEAVLVDSNGAPASCESAVAADVAQAPEAIAVDSVAEPGIVGTTCPENSGTEAVSAPSECGEGSGAVQSAWEAARDGSKASFAALVKAACSRPAAPQFCRACWSVSCSCPPPAGRSNPY